MISSSILKLIVQDAGGDGGRFQVAEVGCISGGFRPFGSGTRRRFGRRLTMGNPLEATAAILSQTMDVDGKLYNTW